MSTSGGAEFFGADWAAPEPESAPGQPPPAPETDQSLWGRIKRAFAPIVAFLALVIKLKSVLFLGSMAVSIAAYAQLWGWKYAVGFVVLLLVHELGHVAALRLRGVRASALVFLPMLGAFTAWEPQERDPYQEAETALAGPVIGTLGSLGAAWYAHSSGSSLWRALAFTGLLLNLFNLIPLIPLDGGRVARLTYPWVWAVMGIGLIGYLAVRPKPLVVVALLLVGYELYSQLRHPDAHGRASIEPGHRWRLSLAYLALVVVIVVGMHTTYTGRTLR
ncbi:MAG TPA: site-2 protease family protein [Mycobacteriales bacterium]|nr:site-2 protease family protein [Mycobacteriales bacterium]